MANSTATTLWESSRKQKTLNISFCFCSLFPELTSLFPGIFMRMVSLFLFPHYSCCVVQNPTTGLKLTIIVITVLAVAQTPLVPFVYFIKPAAECLGTHTVFNITAVKCPLTLPCATVTCGPGLNPTVITRPGSCPTCQCGMYFYNHMLKVRGKSERK